MNQDASDESVRVNGFGERIRQIASAVGGKRALAERTGISPSQLYRYIAEQSQPTIHPLAAIAEAGKVSLDWLITGDSGMDAPGGSSGKGRDVALVPHVSQSFFTAPAKERERHIIERVAMDASWIKDKAESDHVVMAEMSGHNMYPTLVNGDLVLIDQAQNDPLPGKIYAFSVTGKLIIRRLDIRPGGYILHSDDARHTSLEIEDERFSEIEILGRIVWIFREMR